jgi:putative sigma-54 modulation protein
MVHKFQLEGDENINVTVVGKNIEITNPIKQYISEKLEKVEKVLPHIIEVVVRLEVQKLQHQVDIVMKFSHFKVKVHATTTDMYATIDKAFEKLKAKLLRWKSRIQDHHAKGIKVIDLQVNVLEKQEEDEADDLQEINDQIDEENYKKIEQELTPPKVYKKKTRQVKTLTLDEAVMKMELSGDNFLIFRSEEDLEFKVLYRRRDDSYGEISLSSELEGVSQ